MVTLTQTQKRIESGEAGISTPTDDLSGHTHRQVIGYVGLALPVMLIVMAGLRPVEGVEPWRLLGSISAYYYTGATGVFVGLLVVLALFLFTYRGYANRYRWADRGAAVIAGIAALGVTLYPTAAPDGFSAPSWWGTGTGVIHYVSAIILFLMFAVFALWLFRLGTSLRDKDPVKRIRNLVHLLCGMIILGSIAWAGIAGMNDRSIFLPESIALVAFAISWLVKGHALRSIASGVRTITETAGAEGG